MTTAHMLCVLISQWHHYAHHGWEFPRRWDLAMAYLHRVSGAPRGYCRMLLRFLEARRHGPSTWRRWNQS